MYSKQEVSINIYYFWFASELLLQNCVCVIQYFYIFEDTYLCLFVSPPPPIDLLLSIYIAETQS